MVALCSLGAFESLAVSTAMPAVAVDRNGLRHYTVAFAVALATGAVGMLAAGRWCDRSGPTPAMWTRVVLFVIGLVVDDLGWRWVFLGAAGLTIPAALLMRPGLTAALAGRPAPRMPEFAGLPASRPRSGLPAGQTLIADTGTAR